MRKFTVITALFALSLTTGCDAIGGLMGGDTDTDGDGITDADEELLGTDPASADTDGDGIADGDEVDLGTDPLLNDTDGDGLTDAEEVDLGTSPTEADTDGDGVDDATEVEQGRDPLGVDPFAYVLVEDTGTNPSGSSPGADIDAISLIKADGREYFATEVLDLIELDCATNEACDPDGLLFEADVVGDGECFGGGSVDFSLFTSLNAGAVVVSFSTADEEVVVENGDTVHVWEIGSTECGRFDNDPFTVSVGLSPDLEGDWIEMGSGGEGVNLVPVDGL